MQLSTLQILDRSISPARTASICPHMLLAGTLISLESLHLRTIHVLHHGISLPLLEAEAESLMAVILVIGLIFVILHLDEVAVDGVWREGEGDECVQRRDFGDVFRLP